MDRQASALVDAARQGALRQLIDGEWVDGQGPRTAVRDKYTLQPFAELTQADEAQTRRAVDAARAFRRGVPAAYERGVVLEARGRAAGSAQRRVRARHAARGRLRRARGGRGAPLPANAQAVGEARRLAGEVIRWPARPARRAHRLHHPRAAGRGGGRHALQLAPEHRDAQGGAGLRRRQRGDPQTLDARR